MSEIQRVLTPITELELADALYVSHEQVFGNFPSPPRLLMALSQCALELERGKSIWCFNIGNITAGSSWSRDYYVLHVPPPDPPVLKFRAHPNALDGAADYWTFLNGSRYAAALFMFDRADDTDGAFAAAMKLGELHYYLANANVYSRGVQKLYNEYKKRGLEQAEMRQHADVPSSYDLAAAGRLWRIADDVEHGITGIT